MADETPETTDTPAPKKALSTAAKVDAIIELMRLNGWSIPEELDA